jgi:hypothetical protein
MTNDIEDTYGEVHVTLQDGRSIYWPNGDISRYAPAAVCQVTMRIKMLRKVLKKEMSSELSSELRRELERLATPLPYEAAWDSQCSLTVHNAIKRLGDELLSLTNTMPSNVQGTCAPLGASEPNANEK